MSDWKLLNTSTASNVSSVDFTTDMTGYKIYKFVCFDVVPVTEGEELAFNGSVGGSFGVTKTTCRFYAQHNESGSTSGLHYSTGGDLAQSTNAQMLTTNLGNAADECGAGELYLYNPASTTHVKHFYTNFQVYHSQDYSVNTFVGGYFNTTSAIDGIRFTMTSGNISVATIKLYGLVES